MKKRKILNSICLATAMSLTLSLFPAELRAESSTSNEIVSEESGFDETAHGRIINEGECGLSQNDVKPKYKLFEDGTIYIYGKGIIGKVRDAEDIKKAYIENGVEQIGSYTFGGCSNLTDIYIPESIEHIYVNDDESSAFSGCNSLMNVYVDGGNNIYSSENGIIYDKEKTNVILYPRGKIGAVKLPDTINHIGDYAFYGCENLQSMEIPESVSGVGIGSFSHCTSLTNVVLPDKLSTIESETFSHCTSLTNVVLPDKLSTIENGAFYGCENLNNIIIPDSVIKIGNSAFNECSSL